MSFTDREIWGLIHGMVIGAVFLLSFGGALGGLWSLRTTLITDAGVVERVRRLRIGTVAMALAAWATVITGTWIVYPWYRDAADPEAAKNVLLANPDTANWHEFGMEWKEHIAWLSPFLATAAAFVVVYYGAQLVRDDKLRKAAMTLLVLAFVTAAIAGLFGALITKVAPIV